MSDQKLPRASSSQPDVDAPKGELEANGGDALFDGDDDLDGTEDFAEIVEAIASSARPRPIAADVHERILREALGPTFLENDEALEGSDEAAVDPTTVSDHEAKRAEALRRALELSASTTDLDTLDGIEHPDVMRLVALARALRLAFAPPAIASLTSERLLKPALRQPSRRGNARLLLGATTVLAALAAAFVGLWLRAPTGEAPSASLDLGHAVLPMIPVRSTESLFEALDVFPREGGASERIDKISATRGAELRNNRFAAWGVE